MISEINAEGWHSEESVGGLRASSYSLLLNALIDAAQINKPNLSFTYAVL